MRLIITRHGTTEENKKGIMQGHLPGVLSKEGKEEGKKLALRLKDEKIDAIYSSDLKRTADTTKEIVKFHKDVPVTYTKDLRECDLASLAGKKSCNVDWNNRPKDVETREQMRERAKKVIDLAYSKYKDKCVLFVGHNGINRALISIIMGKPAKAMEKIDQGNTAVNIFEIKEDKNHKIVLLNCVKHLE